MGATATANSMTNDYPWTKMNFLVTVSGKTDATAAFSEASGMEATIDVIEFRQGNSGSFSPVKVPGLVKHGNVTLKYGYTATSGFREWARECMSDTRGVKMPRHDVMIELLNTTEGMKNGNMTTAGASANQYLLKDAWICKYTAPEMNALQSEIAIETVEIAFERLELPGTSGSTGGGTSGETTGNTSA